VSRRRGKRDADRRAGSAAGQGSPDPERLDILVPYAPSRAWAAVVALVLVVAGATSWAWFSRVDTQVRLSGVLVAGNGPTLVRAPVSGTVAQVRATPGRTVAAGAVLADLVASGHAVGVSATGGGTVLAALATPGERLQAGQPVVAIDHPGAPLNVALFADPASSLAIAVGQPVSVSGAGGTISGVVSSVSRYLAGPSTLRAVFGTSEVSGAPAKPFRLIMVRLTGLRAFRGATLSPVTVTVTVDVQRPLDAILPGGGR
jgi:biotin carboxyl carrier protein